MTRYCDSCRLHRSLRDFDLGSGQLSSTCLACVHERTRLENQDARSQRLAQIAALETQRRELISALGKLDAEIAELRGRPSEAVRNEAEDAVRRFCASCRHHRPLRDFALGGARRSTCRKCARGKTSTSGQTLRSQLSALEKERRALIAALVKLDAEIVELRERPSSAAFALVEPSDVFGNDPDSSSDADCSFGD